MSCAMQHKFREHRSLPLVFCEWCAMTVRLLDGAPRAANPIQPSYSQPSLPLEAADPQTPEEIEAHVTQLLRASGLKPDDPLLRNEARSVIIDDLNNMEDQSLMAEDEGPDDPIDLDGRRYYERKVPVVDDDELPAAGL